MPELFKTKVREVGTSFGILIPKSIADAGKIEKGDEIFVSVIKKDLGLVKRSFGMAKGAKSFERERVDRIKRYRDASR